jgi:serine/threonine protein kinase
MHTLTITTAIFPAVYPVHPSMRDTLQEVQGRGYLSRAADIYSYGVLLWEMYHGMPPYVFSTEKNKLVGNRTFPKFDIRRREEAPFSFVVLTLACLSTDHQKRCGLPVGLYPMPLECLYAAIVECECLSTRVWRRIRYVCTQLMLGM